MKRLVITPYRDGPLLVRGPVRLADQDGNEIELDRETIALCRCGKSRMRPFCDGTHKLVRFRAPSGPEDSLVSARAPARRDRPGPLAGSRRLRRGRGGARARRPVDARGRRSCDEGRPRVSRRDGKLTVGTDKPAFPPYFEDDDPTNGKGFESAVAYAVAGELGFDAERGRVDGRCRSTPPTRPGRRTSTSTSTRSRSRPARAKRVDFSEPYYTAPQAVIAPKDSRAAERHEPRRPQGRHSSACRSARRASTRSTASIQPTKQPKVFDDSNAVVTALKQDQVDAVVVDLPTACYLTAVEIPAPASSASSTRPAATSGARCWRRTRR